MLKPSRTLAEVRYAFESSGLSISEWAQSAGFRRENVYAVLTGRSKGRRGEAHRIAAALGLKIVTNNLNQPIVESALSDFDGEQISEDSPMS